MPLSTTDRYHLRSLQTGQPTWMHDTLCPMSQSKLSKQIMSPSPHLLHPTPRWARNTESMVPARRQDPHMTIAKGWERSGHVHCTRRCPAPVIIGKAGIVESGMRASEPGRNTPVVQTIGFIAQTQLPPPIVATRDDGIRGTQVGVLGPAPLRAEGTRHFKIVDKVACGLVLTPWSQSEVGCGEKLLEFFPDFWLVLVCCVPTASVCQCDSFFAQICASGILCSILTS